MLRNEAAVKQIIRAAVAEAVCVALMLGVYAVIGRFSLTVMWSALFGYVMAVGNFIALSITVSSAADKAERTGNAAGAANDVRASSTVRLLALLAIYFIVLRFGKLDPVSSLLPLIFMQFALKIMEFFRKEDGEGK